MRTRPAPEDPVRPGRPRRAASARKDSAGAAAASPPKGRGSADPAPLLWAHDRLLLKEYPAVCGVDEAGRGPLAGNVVAACVILDLSRAPLAGLNDSKQVSAEAREALFAEIAGTAVAYGIGESTPEEIDRINILQATFLAMRRAIEAMDARSPLAAGGLLLVDGNQRVPELRCNQRCLVKGDGLSASVAAASILAKVTRDRQLVELHRVHPEYGFDAHKGYGTAAHRAAIARHGLTPFHRRSFCLEKARQESLFGERVRKL
jgi:ribonuclease HII